MAALIYNTSRESIRMDTGKSQNRRRKRRESCIKLPVCTESSMPAFRKQHAKTDTLLSNIQLVKKKSLIWIKSFSARLFPSARLYHKSIFNPTSTSTSLQIKLPLKIGL